MNVDLLPFIIGGIVVIYLRVAGLVAGGNVEAVFHEAHSQCHDHTCEDNHLSVYHLD